MGEGLELVKSDLYDLIPAVRLFCILLSVEEISTELYVSVIRPVAGKKFLLERTAMAFNPLTQTEGP